MKYMGSKNRIAKYILPIMQKARKEGQVWVEPFVGGGNMIDKVDGERIGADSNKYLISLLKEMQKDDFSSPIISEEEYLEIKTNKDKYPEWLLGFAGFQLSYGAMWFGSYRRDSVGVRNYALEAKRNVDKQACKLKGICFCEFSYLELEHKLDINQPCLIYCDPPYANTSGYITSKDFDHEVFWNWCKEMIDKGHTVFVSEYKAPEGWVSVWSKEIVSSLTKDTGAKKGIENLFIHESQLHLIQEDKVL